MKKEDAVKAFGNIVIASRASAINSLKDSVSGNRLKKPFPDAEALYSLIDSLDEGQLNQLVEGFPYLLDLTFFKFLTLVETTDSPVRIELEAVDKSGNRTFLINSEQDLELRSEYWSWIASGNL